ncbi:MAG: family 20 glycosylhydrolase, partial [bacterium]|nr:family 20 glycosylhydrolase [bacterium]
GYEMGGIKIHAPIDMLIKNNRLANCGRGLWLDWMTQGTRVTGNLFYNNTTDDIYIEVSHGPYLIDNNIFLSKLSINDMSEGGAYVHNLIAGNILMRPTGRDTPFHLPHSTRIAGLKTSQGGDNRYFNNIFAGGTKESKGVKSGLGTYKNVKFPMSVNGNVYLNGANNFKKEKDTLNLKMNPGIRITEDKNGVFLSMIFDPRISNKKSRMITTGLLGKAIIPNQGFVKPDGSSITINTDYFGNTRNKRNPTAGPFERPGKGNITLKVWSYKRFVVIPAPREVKMLAGKGLMYNDLKGVYLAGGSLRPVMGRILSSLPLAENTGHGILLLKKGEVAGHTDNADAYTLTVSDGNVEIVANSQAGLFYGCQTLEQLLEDSRDMQCVITARTIVDYPALSFRAVHIDVKHHLDTMKYYYDTIDRLARYKINAVIFEFEDKLRYRRQPLVGAPRAIGIDAMAALTQYARRRHIEINPLVQGLGHASFILKHEKYIPLRENTKNAWAFCPKDEGTYKVLFDMYLDAMEATPGSRYLHIGGDEVGDIGSCPRCKADAKKDGKLSLQLYWLNRVCKFINRHGRTPIFWDDMPFRHAGLWPNVRGYDYSESREEKKATEKLWKKKQPVLDALIDRFPKNCVYMRWTYTPARNPGNIKALDWYKNNHLNVMGATAAQNMSMLLPLNDRVNIIQSYVSLAAERGTPGMLCTAWDDASPHMETYWRGLVAFGEFSWSPHVRSPDEYERAWFHRGFGPKCADMSGAGLYKELSAALDFWGKGFYVNSVRRKPGKLGDLPDAGNPGAWSKKYAKKLDRAKNEIKRYEKTNAILESLAKKAHRNQYHIEILTTANDFQITTAGILLAV